MNASAFRAGRRSSSIRAVVAPQPPTSYRCAARGGIRTASNQPGLARKGTLQHERAAASPPLHGDGGAREHAQRPRAEDLVAPAGLVASAAAVAYFHAGEPDPIRAVHHAKSTVDPRWARRMTARHPSERVPTFDSVT